MRRGGNGLTASEIISRDDTSMTIKLQDGGSRIVLLSPSTSVSTMSAASSSDLVIGTQVIVTGEGNPDGSMTAQTIQASPFSDRQR